MNNSWLIRLVMRSWSRMGGLGVGLPWATLVLVLHNIENVILHLVLVLQRRSWSCSRNYSLRIHLDNGTHFRIHFKVKIGNLNISSNVYLGVGDWFVSPNLYAYTNRPSCLETPDVTIFDIIFFGWILHKIVLFFSKRL